MGMVYSIIKFFSPQRKRVEDDYNELLDQYSREFDIEKYDEDMMSKSYKYDPRTYNHLVNTDPIDIPKRKY